MEEIERLQNKEETEKNIITTLLLALNIIIWSVILIVAIFFMGILKVNAASIDYNNTSNYIHRKTPTQEWLNFNRATDYSLNQTASYDQVNIQWTNYQGGVANGVVVMTITGGTITTATCGELYSAFSVKENGTDTGATITRTECLVNSTSATVRIGFVTSVLGTNSYLEIQFRKQFTLASKINAYGVMTVKQIDPATNTDIQDQTNALINNNNSNTQIITNAVENSTTNIINQMQENLNLCTERNELFENEKNGYYLNISGDEIYEGAQRSVSNYIKINKDTNYEIKYLDSPGSNVYYCLYNENKIKISCEAISGRTTIQINLNQNGYVRTTKRTDQNTRIIGRECKDRTQAEIEELKVLQSLMHTTEWEDETPDDTWFNLYEESEDTLNEYQDVDLSNIDIDIDTDTSNWVWNTLTSLLNTNSYVFGMVITILSIGIGKLILGR